jgi:hypothetical protein
VKEYENAMVEARVTLAHRLTRLVQEATRENLGFFLIYYTALGADMADPMDKILHKASKRCRKLEYSMLADAFDQQAGEAIQHCRAMKDDTKIWLDWWNKKHQLNLSAKDYLRHPSMPSIQASRDLHEDIVAYQSPYAELAIAYELQRTEMIHSFTLIKLAILKFGTGALRRLGFIRRAIQLKHHKPINKKLLMDFLQENPETRAAMIEKARASLLIYGDFLEECFSLAEHESKKYHRQEMAGA